MFLLSGRARQKKSVSSKQQAGIFYEESPIVYLFFSFVLEIVLVSSAGTLFPFDIQVSLLLVQSFGEERALRRLFVETVSGREVNTHWIKMMMLNCDCEAVQSCSHQ